MTFSPRIDIVPAESEGAVRSAVFAGLRAFNEEHAGDSERRPLLVAAKDADERLIGGLVGETAWGWLFIDLLWVAESKRRNGVGRDLVARAEEEALQRGCIGAFLDTLDFQARPFYEKLSYTVFGVQDDYPIGRSRAFLQKRF
ncbi:MAG: GNAT family N-acetyltransferase [Gemmatimonadetes bacterium]|nr:GNAT family N-acetyltransferase [Gemmatimonadota bacterium]